jgi:hypothetical protein
MVLGGREVFDCGCDRDGKSATFGTKFGGGEVTVMVGAVGVC